MRNAGGTLHTNWRHHFGAPVEAINTPSNNVRVCLIYFNAGGGHRAAATALMAELLRQYPDCSVNMVDLFQVLDPKQRFKRMTGFAPETYYNKRLSTGFTLGLAQELKLLQAMIRMSHPPLVAKLVDFWRATQPTMVVSLVPNFNRAIGVSLEQTGLATSFVTVMTDMADHPPHFWIEPGYTQHLICGTDHAVAQAISQGIKTSRIHRTSGMVLSPRFYDEPSQNRRQARQTLGFDPEAAVGLVMFGGHGSAAMKRIATQLADQPLILMCGRNESLKQTLAGLERKAKHHVVGFTEDVAHWMRLADYFIGKPGPGAISEALHCGLPVIVARNAWTMPQERWNTDWIREQNIGRVLPSFTKVDLAVDEVIENLAPLRANVSKLQNRALFEVPQILMEILAATARGAEQARGDSEASHNQNVCTMS